MIKKSWDKIKTTTITNCWHHCGFLENHMLTNDGDDLAANVNKIKIKLKDLHLFAFKPSQNDESSINLMIEEFISYFEQNREYLNKRFQLKTTTTANSQQIDDSAPTETLKKRGTRKSSQET